MSDEPLHPRLAERLTRAARAAQALSETLWEALHDELGDPRERRVAELSERLADVSATVALLARMDGGGSAETARPPMPTEPESLAARASHGYDEPFDEPPRVRESSVATARRPASEPVSEPRSEPASEAVLVDEMADEMARETDEMAPQTSSPTSPEIEIRDERGERDPTAWIAAIGRRLERYARDGVPFAVMLVELADVERLRHAELPGEMSRLTGLVETVLAGELRPADSLSRESPGRYWLLAPETELASARRLAERLAQTVRRAVSHRGAPLQIAVGIAVCPTDGSQAAALAAHADVALYTARAAGRPLSP